MKARSPQGIWRGKRLLEKNELDDRTDKGSSLSCQVWDIPVGYYGPWITEFIAPKSPPAHIRHIFFLGEVKSGRFTSDDLAAISRWNTSLMFQHWDILLQSSCYQEKGLPFTLCTLENRFIQLSYKMGVINQRLFSRFRQWTPLVTISFFWC